MVLQLHLLDGVALGWERWRTTCRRHLQVPLRVDVERAAAGVLLCGSDVVALRRESVVRGAGVGRDLGRGHALRVQIANVSRLCLRLRG